MSELSILVDAVLEFTGRLSAIEMKLAGHANQLDVVLEEVKKQGEKIRMALSATETKLLSSFDDLTNALAKEVDRIVEVIGSLNPDDPEFNKQLQAQVDKLATVKAALEAAGKTPPVVEPPVGGV